MAERLVWTPADGSPAIDLTDESTGYSWEAEGTRGLRSVSYRFASQQYAGIDGDDVTAVTADANHPSIGLLVEARNASELRTRSRALIRAMRPKAGPGLLTVTGEDGDSRSLRCYVEGGLEGDESDTTTLPGRWWKVIVKLYAPDPWWYGPDVPPITWGLEPPPSFFPLLPIKLGASTVQGTNTVDNVGDEDAFGRWTITGPGTGPITLANVTTGLSITVDTTLGNGESLLIDTRPGYRTVLAGDGTNLFGALQSDPAMWPLAPGLNEVSVTMGSATTDSQVLLTYAPRYPGIT